MPLIESKPDALTRTYAKSLFGLVESKGGRESLDQVISELSEIVELARADAKFGEFLSSRVVASAKRHDSLKKVFNGKVHGLTLNFLLLLNDKGRLHLLPAMVASLDQIAQERFGRVEVDAFTVDPMSPDQREQLRQRLSGSLGKEVVLHPYTDAHMIGGIKLRIGDQLVDASVATRLRKLKEQLAGHGGAAIRAKFNSALGQ